MERIGSVAAEPGRVGERLDHLVELDDGTWPPVSQEQGSGARMRRSLVDEVQIEAVDLRGELIEPVQCRFAPAPVVLVGSVLADFLDVGQWRALAPVIDQLGLGPPGVTQPSVQVIQDIVGNSDRERADLRVHAVTVGADVSLRRSGRHR